ncbi:MAG: hypothetical protein IPK71_06795 [Myxococcales bacterium]|jgi:hypothetical protein|nr:hypothetical protein [Myxococcales bacterium]MBL9112378.1 hypothetical protein [Myxococcales bacterium]
MKLSPFVAPVLALALCHCAGFQLPQAPAQPGAASLTEGTAAAPTEGAKAPEAGAPGAPGAKAPEAAKPSVPTMVEIRSECSKTVDVFLGEKPKFGSGTKTQVSGNSTSTRGRKADGTLTVWLIDDKENGIASVNVTPETKRVVIGSSCKDITAR